MSNNKSILSTQQKFKSERINVVTEEINKIVLRSNDDKRTQSIQQAYGTSKDLVKEKK